MAVSNESAQGSSAGATFKGILVLILLVIAAGAGGYFFGTYQKFAPIKEVGSAPSTADATSTTTTAGGSSESSGTLKNKYWIHSGGYDQSGYAITVWINGKRIDKFTAPRRDVDITKYVKPGENTIRFEAQSLPASMRDQDHLTSNWYELSVNLASSPQMYSGAPKEGDTLLKYKRNITETQNYDDTMSFLTVE
jgi:hypothetical protein